MKRNYTQRMIGWIMVAVGIVGLVWLINTGCASLPPPCLSQSYLNQSFSVEFDHRLSPDKAMKAAGFRSIASNEASPAVTRQVVCSFSQSLPWSEQNVSLRLVPVSETASPDEAVNLYGRSGAGGRPATAEELFAFGRRYPEVQKHVHVIAAGTTCTLSSALDQFDSVLVLSHRRSSLWGEPKRNLELILFDKPVSRKNVYLLIREFDREF